MSFGIYLSGKDGVGPIIDKLNKRIDKMEDGLGAVAKQSKVTAREAERLWKQSMSPAEKYNETLRKAKALLDGTAEGQRKYASVTAMANRKLKEQQKHFGASALSELKSYAAGIVGVGTAARVTTDMFRAMATAANDAKEAARVSLDPRAQLAQLAGGSEKEYKRLLSTAERWFDEGVGTTRGEAEQILFGVKSAGAGKETELFKTLSKSRAFGDVGRLATASQAMRTSLGAKAAGTHREVISAALAASAYNPQETQELLTASSLSGGSAKVLGVSPDAMLGMTAISGTAAGRTSLGGTRIAAFLKQVDKSGKFRGIGAVETVRQIQAYVDRGGDVRDILGDRAEAVQGFRDVSGNLGQLETILGEARDARRNNLVGATAGLPGTDRLNRANMESIRQKNRRALREDDIAIGAARVEAVSDFAAGQLADNPNPVIRAWGAFAAPIVERGMNMFGVGSGQNDPIGELRMIREAVEKANDNQGDLQTVEN